jgi:long-chain fatty acid transport protein
VPFGGDVTWPATWAGSSQAIQTNLMVLRAAPFFAWRVGVVRVAAGFHVDAARLQLERGLDFIDTQGDVRLDLAGHGAGADASVYWQAHPELAIALAFRGRTHLTFTGPANFTTPDAFSAKTPDQNASTKMTLPDQLTLGARWHRGTVAFRAGAEWTRDRLVVRGGGYFDPSPVPAEHLVPTSPDASRLGLTAGASWQVAAGWAADIFGERMWLLRRDTTSTDTMPASYGGTAVVVGAGLRFTR